MGIREEKKRTLQKKIELAAKDLFLANEFDDVTMSQISKRAGVGLGTAYNYYGSKEELFLIAGGTAFIFGEGMDLPDQIDSVEVLIGLMANEMGRLAVINRLTWRTSLSSLTKAAEKQPNLFLDLVQMDQAFLASVEEAILCLQEQEKLAKGIDLGILQELIYHTLFGSFLFFIYDDTQSVEQLKDGITQKLLYLLKK